MSRGYQIIEPEGLNGLFAVPKNFDFAFAVFTWLVDLVNVELKDHLVGVEMSVIRVEYQGAYPAIGIHYETSTKVDVGPLVETAIARLLKERSLTDFISYVEQSNIDWRKATDLLMKG